MSVTHRSNNERYTFDTPAADAPLAVLNEFYWTQELEPHVARRKAILKAHPEVAKLTGHEPVTKYYVLAVVVLQLATAYALRHTHPLSWQFVGAAYVVGATCNQAIFLAIHELLHNLLFRKPLHNKLFAIVANVPIGVPYLASFQPYHQLHHKFLGDLHLDTDLPTKWEALVLLNVLGKVFFATCQIFFYALRPMFITQIQFTYVHLLNVAFQVAFDYVVVTRWGPYSLWYFIMSLFLAGSLHPCAGHFIAEHYVLGTNNVPRGGLEPHLVPPETYLYYGPLNRLTWNVGYHNEHHDFPYIAWTRLPRVRALAAEFYDPLPQIPSWCGVIWGFCFNDVNSLWNRVKREGRQKSGAHVGVPLDQN